ncbi:hypothetical protein ACFC09_19300 [Streptomyces sp. NPDC056161]|uniref:hypothetical protein n=1 Tax=Streptomyces sp. NPDC056161 TaxID=3345732 RepID=UPI0035D65788
MRAGYEGEVGAIRVRYRGPLAIGTGCYVLAGIWGMFLLADDIGPVGEMLLWIGHGVVLIALLAGLGAWEYSFSAALFIVFASAMSAYIASVVRDDLTLQRRGEETTVTVVKEWRDPAQGRGPRGYNYEVEHLDGTEVPGPALKATSDRFDVGQRIRVIEDPAGVLRPQTPGQADATGDVVGAGLLVVAALAAVGWMAWRGPDTTLRDQHDAPKTCAGPRETCPAAGRGTPDEQEERLREALRTYPADRSGYVRVHPADYPDVSHRRAARIGRDMGLRAEAFGNRGSWRFGENVVEEVPCD